MTLDSGIYFSTSMSYYSSFGCCSIFSSVVAIIKKLFPLKIYNSYDYAQRNERKKQKKMNLKAVQLNKTNTRFSQINQRVNCLLRLNGGMIIDSHPPNSPRFLHELLLLEGAGLSPFCFEAATVSSVHGSSLGYVSS